jgi:molybdopterin biosynthesis enzyme
MTHSPNPGKPVVYGALTSNHVIGIDGGPVSCYKK